MSKQHASQVLVRKRRANSMFEETKKGNLERECIEELCNKEEAREVFENDPETDYFYPKYLAIPDQCSPLPCNEDGYKSCKDGQARFTCICKPGWQGDKCEYDINECKDPSNVNGGCSQICDNTPGSYHCSCKSGFFMLLNKKDCKDVDECSMMPDICGTAVCKNIPGDFECECAEGYRYNPILKSCGDVDECSENMCAQLCVNYPGGYSCYCDGKKGFKLAQDHKSCEAVPVCLPLNLDKNYELLYLAEQFVGVALYLKFRLPEITRFSAEFDFRTYDSEGVILYAESLDRSAWFLIALRDGRIEIQFKNEFTTKITTGGKVINDGQWNMVSVEELEHSISVKIAKEAVMNINKPESLFKPTNGFLETKVYFAGLPRKMENALIRPDILVSVENMIMFQVEAISLCSSQQFHLELRVNRNNVELFTPLKKDIISSENFKGQLAILDKAMKGTVTTYLGGLPDIPFSATPVNAFYNGCMEVNINGVRLDLDEAVSKHNDIRAHSCPSVSKSTENS
ncbi:hypothetical protein GH733_010968 [Mirounga leonina]|nr:hypothetical protein GH733_010968 [Mirounga leonina]